MERENFKSFLRQLADYYDKNDFFSNKLRNNQYFNKVQHIPGGEVLDFIFNWITDNYDYIPRNLPKAIKGAWQTYKSEHSDKIVAEEESALFKGCHYCLRGWICFRKTDYKSGVEYEYTCLCGHCRPIHPGKIPMLTVDEIRQSGATIIDGRRKEKQPAARYGSVDEIVGQISGAQDEVPF